MQCPHHDLATGCSSAADLDLLQPHLQPVPLKLRLDLEQPNRRIDDVYFPHTGILSVVAVQSKDTRVEVGLIGCEGMSGTSVVLDNDRSPTHRHLTEWQPEKMASQCVDQRRPAPSRVWVTN